MIIISLFLLGTLMPNLSFTAHVNVGIVNGKEAKPHSRPYMVSIQENEEHICGGFLISDKFVLTAAHCRNQTEQLTVVIGAHDLTNMNSKNSVRINVQQYYKHIDFSEKPYFRNDIMLLMSVAVHQGSPIIFLEIYLPAEFSSNPLFNTLVCNYQELLKISQDQTSNELDEKIKKNKYVKWISIPKKEGDIKAGSVCSVAGWGSSVINGSSSPRLMETNVKIMNNKECKDRWERTKKIHYSVSQMMCVYGDGGSCEGDSGGPLVCKKTAVGVTSFGGTELCNSPEWPEVYTKISAFLPWIKSIIKKF